MTMFRIAAVLLLFAVAACNAPSGAPTYAVGGRALAGPTCPVEPASPQPGQCEPRPVAGAVLAIVDASGRQVMRVTTGEDGSWSATLTVGSYTLTPQPVTGLMGGAQPLVFEVSSDDAPSDLRVEYDTGIR